MRVECRAAEVVIEKSFGGVATTVVPLAGVLLVMQAGFVAGERRKDRGASAC